MDRQARFDVAHAWQTRYGMGKPMHAVSCNENAPSGWSTVCGILAGERQYTGNARSVTCRKCRSTLGLNKPQAAEGGLQ